ncbi:YciI family protein [Pseudoalteromonas tunicata]|uniref:YciI family protein n=1 Tax=Pseudoalteromonas tunicata TaxID=314281 RepID=UPI00273D3BF0|nr:YciI family protein [Pseudoalteromonas tunicata]MDP5214125.1 YciI family protein [Pseudoalteromonas tunicata]
MFIVSITYCTDLSQVELLLAEHLRFLDANYQAGHFLASGPKVPRTGGIILANIPSREALHTLLENDPFYRDGIAVYEITEFSVTKAAANLSELVVQSS